MGFMTATPVRTLPDPESAALGKAILGLMSHKDITRKALAAKIKKSASYMTRRFQGYVEWEPEDLREIADVLGVIEQPPPAPSAQEWRAAFAAATIAEFAAPAIR